MTPKQRDQALARDLAVIRMCALGILRREGTFTVTNAFEAVSKALVDFGYPDATVAKIEVAHARWQAGKEPADIIERFAFGDFDKYPEHFGTKREGKSE